MTVKLKTSHPLWLIVPFTVLLGVLAAIGQVWIVMLIIGGIHGSISDRVPALGFWGSALVVFALGILGSFFKGDSK